jgi:hypothetical protein
MSVGELMERMSARTLASRVESTALGTAAVGGAATAEPGTDGASVAGGAGAPDAEAAPEATR